MTSLLRKISLVASVLMVSMMSINAQTYFNVSAGPSFAAGKAPLTTGGVNEGSYAEGLQFHARAGKYITDKLAIELGVGYLHGKNHEVVTDEALGLVVKGAARAYGAALTAKYDVAGGLYARAGVLTKVGGETEVVANLDTTLPASLFNPALPATLPAVLDLDVERSNTGKLPVGFTASLGYELKLSDNAGFFVEAVYDNISVSADKSTLKTYAATATIGENTVDVSAETLTGGITALAQAGKITPENAKALGGLISEEYTYGKDVEDYKSPYSSLGVMAGVSFRF